MSTQEKFEKAVNVIRNLPKNGSYQPSHELQLRFYAYYKQATEGPNRHVRPNFWEVVKRAKWDAWKKLGDMSKEQAMINYVDELRKIVETMAYTDNVANFLDSLDNLDNFYDNVPQEDLDLLVGPVIEKIRSRPNSPLHGSPLVSRDTSPTRASSSSSPLHLIPRGGISVETLSNVGGTSQRITGSLETSPASSYSASPQPTETDDDDDDEHFLDTQSEPDGGKEGLSKKMLRPDKSAAKRCVIRNVTPDRSYLLHRVVANEALVEVAYEDNKGCDLEADLVNYKRSGAENPTPALQSEPDGGKEGATKKLRPVKRCSTRVITPEGGYLPHRVVACDSLVDDAYEDNKGSDLEADVVSHKLSGVENPMPALQRKVTFESSSGIPLHDAQSRTSLQEPSTVTTEAFNRAIANMTKEMENLQKRVELLETIRLQEVSAHERATRWWSLPLTTTAALFVWPVLILVMSQWLATRRRR